MRGRRRSRRIRIANARAFLKAKNMTTNDSRREVEQENGDLPTTYFYRGTAGRIDNTYLEFLVKLTEYKERNGKESPVKSIIPYLWFLDKPLATNQGPECFFEATSEAELRRVLENVAQEMHCGFKMPFERLRKILIRRDSVELMGSLKFDESDAKIQHEMRR